MAADAAQSNARAQSIAEQLIRDRVLSAKPAQEALSDVEVITQRELHGKLTSNPNRHVDISVQLLAVLRAPALYDRVRNDTLTRRTVALQANSHIVQYVNTFVGTWSHPKDASLASQARLWVCTERMHLGTLEQLIEVQRIAFGEPHAATVIRGIATALEFLHGTHQIAHRAVAPDTVFINEAGAVKLSDFSIAADLTQKHGPALPLPRDLRTSKRVFWIAPELADETATHCERADVFSCTLLVYGMLDGVSPFASMAPQVICELLKRARVSGQLTLPLRTAASPLLTCFLDFGLTVQPEKRPSAAELVRHPFLRSAAPNDAFVQFIQSGVQRA